MDILHHCICYEDEVQNPMRQCCFQMIFKVNTTLLASSVTQTLFCPMCWPPPPPNSSSIAELWQPSFCPQSRLVILMSLLTAHTAKTPSKHVRTYGKYSFLECNWQPLPVKQRNKRAVRSFYEGIRQTWQHSQSLINGPLKHLVLLMCSEKK